MADAIDWPDLEDYGLARDAVGLLTFDYDSVRVERKEPKGTPQWRVECWSRPRCRRCQGDGYEPERRPQRCKRCEGVGREHGALSLKKVFIVHSDGRIRREEQA